MVRNVRNKQIITVTDSRVIPLVTEQVERRLVRLINKMGVESSLKPHQFNKQLINFLEASDIIVEYLDFPAGRRGVSTLVGLPVKVSPVRHTNYDGGARIEVDAEDEIDLVNANRVIKFLHKKGIDVDKYCGIMYQGTSCNNKLKECETK